MTAATLHWGVLGTANIGRAVNPAIHAAHNSALVAVASRDAGKARAYAQQWSIPRCHASYLDLLADAEIDAVYIPLPNGLHKEWTIRAAEHGKHILCEKPLALTANECREMHHAAVANGVTLMEAFMYRFHPRTERVIALVKGGSLGVTSELKSAFQIGFLIFIPFLVIDMIVASVLMSLGMMMLSPVLVALPFKLMLFVLADGWNLLLGSLAASFSS